MKDVKDNFSKESGAYKKFRPTYPEELYTYLYTFVNGKQFAWDCGTGNGQVASHLAEDFEKVYATDISENQIKSAVQLSNIEYHVQRGEVAPPIEQNSLDLITVGQAFHWFDFDAFFANAIEFLKADGLLAIWGYGLLSTNHQLVNEAIQVFYTQTIDRYWDAERRHIDEAYSSVHHPSFNLIESNHSFRIKVSWTLERLVAYLNTWSAVRHYKRINNSNPVDLFSASFEPEQVAGVIEFEMPIFIKLFRPAKQRVLLEA